MKRFLLAGALGLTLLMAQKQPTPKSQKEVDAINAMFQAAQDPDARIKAADFLMTKFADTEFKPLAMFLTAEAYERKGDFEKMTVWCEKTLEVDPKNYSCMLMLSGGIAKRARENDLDLNEKLDRSDKYAKAALEALKDAPKPNPQIRQVAQAERVRAIQAKGGGAPKPATPATPGGPTVVEPKK